MCYTGGPLTSNFWDTLCTLERGKQNKTKIINHFPSPYPHTDQWTILIIQKGKSINMHMRKKISRETTGEEFNLLKQASKWVTLWSFPAPATCRNYFLNNSKFLYLHEIPFYFIPYTQNRLKLLLTSPGLLSTYRQKEKQDWSKERHLQTSLQEVGAGTAQK